MNKISANSYYTIQLKEQDTAGDMKYLVTLLAPDGNKGWMIGHGKWNGKSKKEAIKQADKYAELYQAGIEYKFLNKRKGK